MVDIKRHFMLRGAHSQLCDMCFLLFRLHSSTQNFKGNSGFEVLTFSIKAAHIYTV